MKYLAALMALFVPVLAHAQNIPQSLPKTLPEFLALAAAQNPEAQAARLDAAVRGEDEAIALTALNPRVMAEASGGLGAQRSVPGAGKTTNDLTLPLAAQLSVRQPLYRGGRTEAAVARARAFAAAAKQGVASVQQAVMLQAGMAYLGLWREQQFTQLWQKSIGLLTTQQQAAQAKFDVGVVTKTDIAQADSRLAAAQSGLASTQGRLQSAWVQLLAAVGLSEQTSKPAPNGIAAPATFLQQWLPANLASAQQQGVANNPNIQTLVAQAKAQGLAADEVLTSTRPEIFAQGTFGQQYEPTPTLDHATDARALLGFSIPLYDQGLSRAQARQANLQQQQILQQVVAARNNIEANIATAWANEKAAKQALQASQTQLVSAQTALEGVILENENGVRDTLDVLNAERELLDARLEEAQAQYNVWAAQLQIVAAMGMLPASSVAVDVPVIAPKMAVVTPAKKAQPIPQAKPMAQVPQPAPQQASKGLPAPRATAPVQTPTTGLAAQLVLPTAQAVQKPLGK